MILISDGHVLAIKTDEQKLSVFVTILVLAAGEQLKYLQTAFTMRIRQVTSVLPYIGVILSIFTMGKLLRHPYIPSADEHPLIIKTKKADDSKNLKLFKEDGEHILNLDISDYFDQPLKIWDYRNEAIAFMHIGKSGGTSFDRALLTSKHKDGCRLHVAKTLDPVRNITCPRSVQCMCERHYDWGEYRMPSIVYDLRT